MKPRAVRLAAAVVVAAMMLIVLFQQIERAASQALSPTVIISEVAWAGTLHSPSDEWIELYNTGDEAVALAGWSLADSSGDVQILLQGVISPGGFFLLERTADDSVMDVPADQIYVGSLGNGGEALALYDASGVVVDSANGAGGAWPAGKASPHYVSMERVSPTAADAPENWVDNDGQTLNGVDAGGNGIQGTPRAANSAWTSGGGPLPELSIAASAPATAYAGALLNVDITIVNNGPVVAQDLVVTATLPPQLSYVGDSSGVDASGGGSGALTWQLGALGAGDTFAFVLTARVAPDAHGTVSAGFAAGSGEEELNRENNITELAIGIIAHGSSGVLIGALLYDGYESGDADEALQLINGGPSAVDVGGWLLSNGRREAALESGLEIAPLGSLWLARDATAFARQFGFLPDSVVASWPGFANDGDEVVLRRADGVEIDRLVYKDGDTSGGGWQGAAVEPYRVSNLFAEEGQLLYRMRDESSGLPLADSNTAADWAQWRDDPVIGRKVRYPGWSYERFFHPAVVSGAQPLSLSVAPDNAFATIVQAIDRAQHSIIMESLTFENVAIGDALMAASGRGVAVSVLLEGAPVSGIDDQERYVCQRLEAAGGACWFMIRDSGAAIHDRYRYLHAKFIVVDERLALVSTENLSPYSLPDDEKGDGTWGRRGLVIATTEAEIVQRLVDIFYDDLDPVAHVDLFRWQVGHPQYGLPPAGFTPITVTGGTTYTVRYPHAVTFDDVSSIGLFQAPENMLRSSDGLMKLLANVGAGDTVLVQQLSERVHWGASAGNPLSDPNPRLEAYLNAARRGAVVRLMLDAHFDAPADALSNAATCAYVQQIAETEHLRLRCVVANPTGLGIHNKMVLLNVAGKGWVHAGSWNGTEQSTKGNREVALQFQSDAAYAYLAALFEADWPHENWLPIIGNGFQGAANYPLISEILYDPAGADDGEYIELNNPTADAIDLSGWTISDAVAQDDFEDARRFPDGTLLPPRSTIVVAMSAARFEQQFYFLPDFEILNSRADVPDMIDDPSWGDPAAILQLGNDGDEVLLRTPTSAVVDVVTYGVGQYPGQTACPLVATPGHVLERIPYWRDSDNCLLDFRAWPFPSPGALP